MVIMMAMVTSYRRQFTYPAQFKNGIAELFIIVFALTEVPYHVVLLVIFVQEIRH